MKTILAAVDFSPVSDAVVASAASLARALEGRVVLLSVIQPPVMLSEYAPLMENIAEITAAGEKNAERRLAKLVEKLQDDFVPTDSSVETGSPAPVILNKAEEVDADFIVVGSHGHTALYDLLVGSTTHGVLLRAPCPVIIVPAATRGAPRKAKTSRAALV